MATRTRLTTDEVRNTVPCEFCGAPVGSPCLCEDLTPTIGVHLTRYEAALDAPEGTS